MILTIHPLHIPGPPHLGWPRADPDGLRRAGRGAWGSGAGSKVQPAGPAKGMGTWRILEDHLIGDE